MATNSVMCFLTAVRRVRLRLGRVCVPWRSLGRERTSRISGKSQPGRRPGGIQTPASEIEGGTAQVG
jgi:hypothetical protein